MKLTKAFKKLLEDPRVQDYDICEDGVFVSIHSDCGFDMGDYELYTVRDDTQSKVVLKFKDRIRAKEDK